MSQIAGQAYLQILRDKLQLPINREKSGIRRPSTFEVLGFVPTYKKGEMRKYQFVVKKSKRVEFKSKLKELTKKTMPMILMSESNE